MYGSRNQTSQAGARNPSSLDALNRTIEGLEARVEGLLGQAPGSATRAPHHHHPIHSDPLAAIRARQEMLERRSASPDSRAGGPAREQHPRGTSEAAGRVPPHRDGEISALARALADMRHELKADIQSSLTGELSELRREIRELAAGSRDSSMPEDLRNDLARISASIDRLDGGSGQFDSLRLELDSMRHMIDGMAREDSVRALESRWQMVEDQVSGFDMNGIRDDLVNLAYRIDDIRESLSSMPPSGAGREIEKHVAQLSLSIEELARRPELPVQDLVRNFDVLGARLDEVSRAVAALQLSPAAAFDPAPMERLEARLTSLVKKIDAMELPHLSADVGGRIDAVASRISQLADEEAVGRLDARLAHLQTMLENGAGRSETGASGLAESIAELSGKIERIDGTGIGDHLAARLDDLAARIDALQAGEGGSAAIPEAVIGRLESLIGRVEAGSGHTVDTLPGMETLEARLSEIAARLDSAAAPPFVASEVSVPGLDALEARLSEISDKLDRPAAGADFAGHDEVLRGLETQITNLSRQIASVPAADDAGRIDSRLGAIEEHLATNDEYVIEAARQAAEAALSAFSGRAGGAGHAQPIANIEVITALADDLKALEALSRKSEDRTSRAFEAVQETLLKIASRMEKLDVLAAESRPRMPKASVTPLDESYEEGFEDAAGELQAVEAAHVNNHGRMAHQSRTPAEAAALAAAFANEDGPDESDGLGSAVRETATYDDDAGDDVGASEERSFLAGLASRMKPRRNADRGETAADEPGNGQAARSVEPRFTESSPPLDPSMELGAALANMPLEPGSGAPDINRILQKVRQAQAEESRRGESPAGDKSEFLASARRAAMAAAAEVETLSNASKKPGGSSRFMQLLKARRRPILLGIGAILLAMMAVPLATGLMERSGEQATVETTADAEPQLAEQVVTEPASVETAALDVAGPEEAGGEPVAVAAEAGSEEADGLPSVRLVEAEPEPSPAATSMESTGAVNASTPMDDTGSAGEPADLSAEAEAEPSPVEKVEAELEADLEALPTDFIPPALRNAATELDPLALYEIGARFTEGRGGPVDLERAAKWYRRAADLGHAPSQYRIANFYEKGSGLERDIDSARKWYQLAAEQGNASAMHNLAVLYATAGDAPDYESAAQWFEKAANVGVRDSQVNLAILYARGDGVARDLVRSYKWFAIAANDGDKDAAAKRDEVYNALSPEQISAARDMVAGWKVQPLDAAANSVEVPAEWGGAEMRTASVDMSKAIRNIQAILNNNGFEAGTPDGIMGAKTVSAIKKFQSANGMEPTGEITDGLVRQLLAHNV